MVASSSPQSPRASWLAASAVLLSLSPFVSVASAQSACTPTWSPLGNPYDDPFDGPPTCATLWDADGAGPGQLSLVVGGSFYYFGTQSVGAVNYDPTQGAWSSIGALVPQGTASLGTVRAVLGLPNGNLIVGGQFNYTFNPAAFLWNGTSWSSIAGLSAGTTPGLGIHAMTVLPNGNVVVGGTLPTTGVHSLSGSTWTTMPGIQNVRSLTTLAGGDVLAGGQFALAGGLNRIARWNGATWNAIGSGFPTGSVDAVAELSNGDLIAGGTFTMPGGPNYLARWDGSVWSALGAGVNGAVTEVTVLSNGDLLAAGSFTMAGGAPANGIARWNGTTWSPMGDGMTSVAALTSLPGGIPVAVGISGAPGSIARRGAFRWDGTAWRSLITGLDGPAALAAAADGSLVAAGGFTEAGSIVTGPVARWDGTEWSSLAASLGGSSPYVGEVAASSLSSDVYVGGRFTSIDGVATSNVARWDGSQWLTMGTHVDSVVRDLVMGTGSEVLVTWAPFGGTTSVLHGYHPFAGWTSIALGTFDDAAWTLATLPNGHVVAGGQFTTVDGVSASRIAIRNGSTWTALGSGINSGLSGGSVVDIAVLPNGSIVAGGSFSTPGNNVALWDGTSWSPLGAGLDGQVNNLMVLPSGSIVASGAFTTSGGNPVTSVAIWNGTSWQPFSGPKGQIVSSAYLPSGEVWASVFDGSQAREYTARLRTPCSAKTEVAGAGCGTNQLTATKLPWIGNEFESLASGLPAASFSLSAFGSSVVPGVDLSTLFAEGVPGCDLHAYDPAPLLVGSGTAVITKLFIPNNPALVGVQLFHQVFPIDTSNPSTWTMMATNSLALTIGSF